MELDLDVIRGLALPGDKGLLPPTHVVTYQTMNSFRNRVVHLYLATDPREVYRILQEGLDDFRMFIADVQRIVSEQQQNADLEAA
jgi:uncharacterized protein YutE (UPF0331/DUF86 family)